VLVLAKPSTTETKESQFCFHVGVALPIYVASVANFLLLIRKVRLCTSGFELEVLAL
jgi:hypothetical protein